MKYRGEELIGLSPGKLNRYRGSKLTMIFQEPMTSLDPLYRVGDQLALPLHGARGSAKLPPGNARSNSSSWYASRTRSAVSIPPSFPARSANA